MTLVIKDGDRDSTIWNGVKPRKTDIIICSCYKSGTTLTQQIVNLLINGSSEFKKFKSLHELSPWVEETSKRFFSSLETKLNHIEKLPEPRFLKSHLPFEALPYYPEWKYLYLVRDGREVALSLYHHEKAVDSRYYELIVKPEESFVEFWEAWIETGRPAWLFLEHVQSWWQFRHLPNVLLVHYSDLIKDKLKEVERIADFLNIKIDSPKKDIILHQSSLQYMTENWEKFQAPGLLPKSFFGNSKKVSWKQLLPPEKSEKYEKLIIEKLGFECANWVKNGGALPELPKSVSGSTTRLDQN
jgi:aryl sulfotransferase